MSDFLFERDEPLDQTRAYTRIDFNQAILGNRWIERTWSGFFGTTTSLVNRGNGSEWVVAQNPEFSLVANGDAVVPIDLGEIDVTEECSDLGASLIVRKGRADLNVTIISTALHDVPAMIRSVTVQNTGADPMELESVSSEMLEFEEESGELVAHRFFEAQKDPYVCTPEDPCAAFLIQNRGMLFGTTPGGEIHLNSPELFQCNVVWKCGVILAPFEKWTTPMTYLIPCDGDPLSTYIRYEPEVIEQLRLAKRQAEKERAALEDDEG